MRRADTLQTQRRRAERTDGLFFLFGVFFEVGQIEGVSHVDFDRGREALGQVGVPVEALRARDRPKHEVSMR